MILTCGKNIPSLFKSIIIILSGLEDVGGKPVTMEEVLKVRPLHQILVDLGSGKLKTKLFDHTSVSL